MVKWDTVLTKWEETCSTRFKQLKKLLNIGLNIPILKPRWYYSFLKKIHIIYVTIQLLQIDVDFEYLFPGTGNNLLKKWDLFAKNIIPYFKSAIKDKLSSELLKELESDQSLTKGKDFFLKTYLY